MTHAQLLKLLRYDPNTGHFYCRIARLGAPIGKQLGCVRYKYLYIWLERRHYAAHRLAWFYSYGHWPKELDHVNRNALDNRLCNLREATRSQNLYNIPAYSSSSTGIKGIHRVRRATGRYWWRVRITNNTRRIHLGYFKTKEEAGRVYNKAAQKYHGDFCCENIL